MQIVSIVLLIVGMPFVVLGAAFSLAAVLTFANYQPTPPDPATDREMLLSSLLNRGAAIAVFVIAPGWRDCPLGRKLAYTSLACHAVGALLAASGTWWSMSQS